MVETLCLEDTMTARYAWIITRDHLLDPMVDDHEEDCDGTAGPRGATQEQIDNAVFFGNMFRMLDDDGNVMYEGRLWVEPRWEYEVFGDEPLHDFGIPYAGCTSIEFLEPLKGTMWVTRPGCRVKVPALAKTVAEGFWTDALGHVRLVEARIESIEWRRL